MGYEVSIITLIVDVDAVQILRIALGSNYGEEGVREWRDRQGVAVQLKVLKHWEPEECQLTDVLRTSNHS